MPNIIEIQQSIRRSQDMPKQAAYLVSKKLDITVVEAEYLNLFSTASYRAIFYHRTLKDSRGEPVKCRVNGKCKLWKTRPADFRLPVKYGLYDCFYITPENASEWTS